MKLSHFLLFLFFTFNLSHYGKSQTCCSGGVPMSGNLGLPASEKGTFQFSLNYDLNTLKTLKTERETLEDRDRLRQTHSVMLEMGYTFNEKLSIDFFSSYVRQERTIYGFNNQENFNFSQGIGDAVVLFKYKKDLGKNGWAMFGLGPKLPTGSSDKTNNQGITLSADLQPGSGAWDMILWGHISHQFSFRPSSSLLITSTYRNTGVNDSYLGSIAYEFGNELQILVSIADRLNMGSLLIDPSITFRYRQAGQDINNDLLLPNSGGEWLFLVPGVSISLNSVISVNGTFEWPIYSRVQGIQLTPTNRLNFGLFYIIRPKANTLNIENSEIF